MRSPQEILFRLRQEFHNSRMFAFPPAEPPIAVTPLPLLPTAESACGALKGTPWGDEVVCIAESVLAHRIPLLGTTLDTGPEIAWRRDYASGIETDKKYFRTIPYLDAARAGDHKLIWELNRHQHLVLLTQAAMLTRRDEFQKEAHAQLLNWMEENPFLRGINWTSALEVAFRALSWVWIYHWSADRMPSDLRERFLRSLHQHGAYLEHNLSVYFSPNTHLLGEAVVLHLLGRVFPEWPSSARWEQLGSRIVVEEMARQVRPDGGHFEQSSYYHVYAVDFFLLHKMVARSVPSSYDERLSRMADLLQTLMQPGWRLPMLGDEDGGRLHHPYGPRDRFGRGTLALAAVVLNRPDWLRESADLGDIALWWTGGRALELRPGAGTRRQSRLFADTGLAVMHAADVAVVVDAGPFGPGSGGHSHSDTLGVVACGGEDVVLADVGTYTYVGDAAWRNWFRGTAAHNTVRINGRDQGVAAGPFRWSSKPETGIGAWRSTAEYDYLDAFCRYDGFRHRRVAILLKPTEELLICDIIDGPPGEHDFEQFWHPGAVTTAIEGNGFQIGRHAALFLPEGTEGTLSVGGEHGWRSPALGHREESPVIIVRQRAAVPAVMAAAISFRPHPPIPLRVSRKGEGLVLHWSSEVEVGAPGDIHAPTFERRS